MSKTRHEVLKIIAEKAPYNKDVWNSVYSYFVNKEIEQAKKEAQAKENREYLMSFFGEPKKEKDKSND